jgi:type II secretory pathway component PulK
MPAAPSQLASRNRRRTRRGVVLLAAVAILAIVALAALALAASTKQLRAANRIAERRLQAELLVTSGFDRAAARLARDASYQGETWKLPAAELHLAADETAEVAIAVKPGAQAGEFRVNVQATWPVGSPEAVNASDARTLRVPGK